MLTHFCIITFASRLRILVAFPPRPHRSICHCGATRFPASPILYQPYTKFYLPLLGLSEWYITTHSMSTLLFVYLRILLNIFVHIINFLFKWTGYLYFLFLSYPFYRVHFTTVNSLLFYSQGFLMVPGSLSDWGF